MYEISPSLLKLDVMGIFYDFSFLQKLHILILLIAIKLEFSYFVSSKSHKTQQLGFVSPWVARGLNLPLKHAEARNKRAGFL